MDWQAHNAEFVVAAYAITAIGLVGLLLVTLWRARRSASEVDKLKPPGA
jgi:heme exporter protein CcmD